MKIAFRCYDKKFENQVTPQDTQELIADIPINHGLDQKYLEDLNDKTYKAIMAR